MGAYDKWGAFSDPFPIHDVTPFANGVLLATDGGLRFRSIYENVVYHSEHGLETSRFYSVVSSNNAVYAVSEYGLIATDWGGQTEFVPVSAKTGDSLGAAALPLAFAAACSL